MTSTIENRIATVAYIPPLLGPCLRQVAGHQANIGDAVADASTNLLGQLIGKVTDHFRSCHRLQTVQVVLTPRRLDALEQLFELLVVAWADRDRRRSAAATRGLKGTRARRAVSGEGTGTSGKGGPATAGEAAEKEPAQHDEKKNLQQETEKAAEPEPTAKEAVTE